MLSKFSVGSVIHQNCKYIELVKLKNNKKILVTILILIP